MRDNKLWEGYRIILPEMREKAARYCQDCRFFVKIQGREEARWGCVASIPAYDTLQKRVLLVVHVAEVLQAVGKTGLEKILEHGNPEAQACGLYRDTGSRINQRSIENLFSK